MKVYLVYPDVTSFHGLPYHPGLASIAAVLQEHGHEVKIGYLDSVEQYKGIVDLVESFEPDVVGFTTVETQFIHVQRLAAMIKAKRNCVVICGGTYMTLAPEAALEPASKSLDGIIRGDGEYALLELVEKVGRGEDYHDVYNLCYVDPRTGRLVQNPLRPAIGRLEDIPHPVTDLFEYQKIIDEHNLVLFHFSRGCPYPCTYCSARVLMTQYGQSVRYRSVDSTIEEIKTTVERYRLSPASILLFSDDLFTLNKKWLYEFLPKYEREIGLPFMCNTRSNIASEELFECM